MGTVTNGKFRGMRAWRPIVALLAAALAAVAGAGYAALPLDDEGWSILAPSADSRLFYVSDSEGDDATGQYVLPDDPAVGPDPRHPVGTILAYKTLDAAYALARTGFPDWVLLKRGDAWVRPATMSVNKVGRGDQERLVLTSYGPPAARPLLKYGERSALSGVKFQHGYLAIVGLDFYAHTRDPQSPDYAPELGGGGGMTVVNGGGVGANFRGLLVEDCRFRFFVSNIALQVIGEPGANVGDIVLRRNVIADSWSGSSHSQGMYGHGLRDTLIEENVFDHCGWLIQGDGSNAQTGGMATFFNHDTYFGDCSTTTFRGNLFLRAASIGNKWRADATGGSAGLVVDNNLYVEGEVGIGMGGNTSEPFRFVNPTVTRNVVMHLGRSHPTGRSLAWGMDVNDWDGGTIAGNLFVHQQEVALANAFALVVHAGSTRNVAIRDNLFYGMNAGANFLFRLQDVGGGISVTGNRVLGPTTANRLVELLAPSDYSFTSNTYWSSRTPQSQWFRVGGVDQDFPDWVAASGETNATSRTVSFPRPDRTIETYDAWQDGPGTFDHFIAEARQQTRANWRTQYTAAAVNDYVRLGFGIGNRAPYFLANPLPKPAARIDTAYAGSLVADANDQDLSDSLTFAKVGGPAWLTVAPDGALSGTPTAADVGVGTFLVRVTDMCGAAVDATMTITVPAPPRMPAPALTLH